MNLGVTLKSAEKVFGPALPGPDTAGNTLSAIRFAKGKGKKFAGVAGIRDDANFYIHFPMAVEWNLLQSKKGLPDFINDLQESGPQSEQGRGEKVEAFLESHRLLQEKRRAKEEAVEKKRRAAKLKEEASAEKRRHAVRLAEEAIIVRERLATLLGNQQATITIGPETVTVLLKVTMDKVGKIKLSATV